MHSTIHDFYYGDFKKIFLKNSFKSFLKKQNRMDALDSLTEYWNQNKENKYFFYMISEDLIDMYALYLGDIYHEFSKKVDWLLENGIRTINSNDSKKDTLDFIFLNNLRIIRKINSTHPAYFLRSDKNSPSFEKFDDNWIEVNADEINFSELLSCKEIKPCDITPNQSTFSIDDNRLNFKGDLIKLIFKLATHGLFISETSKHSYLFGKAKLDWANQRLSGLPSHKHTLTQPTTHKSNFDFDENCRFSHVAGLLGFIYTLKNKDSLLNRLVKCRNDINQNLDSVLAINHFKYLKKSILISDENYQKIIFLDFLQKNYKDLSFWEKESQNKVFYLVFLTYNRTSNIVNSVDQSFFSYENMIGCGGLWAKDHLYFPSKKSMKNAFKMNIEAFKKLFPPNDTYSHISQQTTYFSEYENAWRLLTLWLEVVEQPVNLKYTSLIELHKCCLNLFIGKTSPKIVSRLPIAVNLIYKLICSTENSEMESNALWKDTLDYISGNDLVLKENGAVVKVRKKNIEFLDSKTTINSLLRKSIAWHKKMELYDQYEMTKKGENYKKYVYSQFTDLSFNVGQFNFKLINNRYSLLREGVDMRHCVSTYHNKIISGKYVVFSVTQQNHTDEDCDFNKYTLGIKIRDNTLIFDQCKGLYNSPCKPEVLAAAEVAIKLLNNNEYVLYSEKSTLPNTA